MRYIDHAEKMHELPDEYLSDVMPIAKKIALAEGMDNYNVLQNNGRVAHQVMKLHCHLYATDEKPGCSARSFPRNTEAERE